MWECPNKRWTEERRERMATFHRKRLGAPDGFCTVHGLHVPVEYGDSVRYWANWFTHNLGKEAARDFILGLKADPVEAANCKSRHCSLRAAA